ncbi:MAG: dockerin type I repeat-containing protein, partial [Clostridia bacterium]|nr:dockerin type I repeat-containing protein [Clostridia bacterium]
QILSLTFEILETAATGETSVYLTFPDNGVGWYFSGLDPAVDYTVPADGEVSCAVTVSDTPVYTAGDLNGDGKINAVDCNIMKTIIIGKTVAEDWQALAADMDGDGKVNIADSNLLRRAVTGKA